MGVSAEQSFSMPSCRTKLKEALLSLTYGFQDHPGSCLHCSWLKWRKNNCGGWGRRPGTFTVPNLEVTQISPAQGLEQVRRSQLEAKGPRKFCLCFTGELYNMKKETCILFYLLFFNIFIVIQLQLYAFSPHPSTPPQLNPPPSPTSTHPLDFVHVSFIVVPIIPSSHCPHPTPPWLLLDCS